MAVGGWGAAVGGAAIAAGVAFAGLMVGESLVEMRRADRVVTVKGLAERPVEADVASWRIPFRAEGADAARAIAGAEAARAAVDAFARAGGMADEEVSTEPYSLRVERVVINTPTGQQERARYVAVSAIRVRTDKVAALAALTGETKALLDAGVLLGDNDYAEASKAEYLFTGLNAIKPDLIAEATRAARASAAQFAEDSGARVGEIARANQGVIQILPRDGGFNERQERQKIVRVVSTVSFRLE
ncbi:MAG: SIMPL domain-containing protein [Pseudomonadota bacterium]